MALTAIAPSTLPHDRSWDEAIVPALRKRLESESHALSKRMSAASMASNDDLPQNTFSANASYVYREAAATPALQSPKPSAIPRPSLQQARTAESSTAINGRSSRSSSFQRNRTLSQPFPFERPGTSSTSYPQADSSSRSASPMVSSVKSTRIPVSRVRTGSVSSSKQQASTAQIVPPRVESRSGMNRGNGQPYQPYAEPMPDLWSVNEHHQLSSTVSRSTLRTARSQVSELANEQPPFNASSVSSRGGYDSEIPRMSAESEEHPFEHWYRGDVSRNGGVGELRVVKRQEMLDIANYGHPLRSSSSRTELSGPSRSRSNSRGRDARLTHRPRAESVGGRESIYIDNDDRIQDASMVLDEHPPTDLDSGEDEYDDIDHYYADDGYGQEGSLGRDGGAVFPPLSLDRSDTPTTIVDPSKPTFRSRIPTPTPRQISEASRAETPTQSSTVTPTEPTAPKGKPSASKSAQKLTIDTNHGMSNKRRAKSPASAVSSAKKTRIKSPAKPQPKKVEKRQSIAQYPTPEGDDMIHAIPSWTQAVPPPSGNWDDAVLPVVARKKGLEGQYQQADGNPKPPPKTGQTFPEPAPGTFGFKYRPSRNSTPVENVPMDDLARQSERPQLEIEINEPRPSDSEKLSAPPSPLPRVRTPGSPRAQSPAPFSQYPASPAPVPQIRVTRPSSEAQKDEMHANDEQEAGCCKCVIM